MYETGKKRIQMKASSGHETKFKRCHQYIRLLLSVFNDLCHIFKDNLTFIKAEFDLVPAPIFLKHIHPATILELIYLMDLLVLEDQYDSKKFCICLAVECDFLCTKFSSFPIHLHRKGSTVNSEFNAPIF